MKRKDKMLSVANIIDRIYLYNGIAWIVTGVTDLFSEIKVFGILTPFSLLCSVVLIITAICAQKERQDELFVRNITKAQAGAHQYMHGTFLVLIMAWMGLTRVPETFPIQMRDAIVPSFFLFIGVDNLIVGWLFRKYERDEEECIF